MLQGNRTVPTNRKTIYSFGRLTMEELEPYSEPNPLTDPDLVCRYMNWGFLGATGVAIIDGISTITTKFNISSCTGDYAGAAYTLLFFTAMFGGAGIGALKSRKDQGNDEPQLTAEQL